MLLRRTEEAAKMLQEQRRRISADGDFYSLVAIDSVLGLQKILQGDIGDGIHWIGGAILRGDTAGYRCAADWYRLNLAEAYLEIIAGNEKPPFSVLVKNLPILLKIVITASSRITALMTQVLKNPHYDGNGFQIGKSEMILGLLHKAKKKRALAVQHLTEAKRIISQFGQSPLLTRIDAALAELG